MMLIKKRSALKIECFILSIRIYVQFIISAFNSYVIYIWHKWLKFTF